MSPGFVPHYNMYQNRYDKGVDYADDPNEELSAVKNENSRLKQSLTRVQSECEELRDESNFNRAKILELSDLVSSSNSPKQMTAMKDSLIAKKKEKENAELTLAVNKLEVELYQSELKLEELQLQKKANNKLLLEMGDVIRALNAIDIECDPSLMLNSGNNPENLTPQQMSIKNIKLKVDAMKKDREQLVERCKELEGECVDQQLKVDVLESRFQFVNKPSNGFNDAATLTTCSQTTEPQSPFSASSAMSIDSASTIDDEASFSQASKNAPQSSIIIQYEKEISLYKEKQADHAKELFAVRKSQQIQKDKIQRLEKQNENTYSQLTNLREELVNSRLENRNIAIKRDELKSNLNDIMNHYKSLNIEHDAAKDTIKELQSHIDRLEAELESSKRDQEENEKEEQGPQEQEQEQVGGGEEKATIEKSSSASSDDAISVEDLTLAYGRAKKRIKELELRLIQVAEMSLIVKGTDGNGERQLHPAINRYKTIERERNEFEQQLKKALEETRLARLEVEKEREASKEVRRRLAAYTQQRILKADADTSKTSSTRSVSSRASARKERFKPLTLEELIKKDFS